MSSIRVTVALIGLFAAGFSVMALRGREDALIGSVWFTPLSVAFFVNLAACTARRITRKIRARSSSHMDAGLGLREGLLAFAPDLVHLSVMLLVVGVWVSSAGTSGTVPIYASDAGTLRALGGTGVGIEVREFLYVPGDWKIVLEARSAGGDRAVLELEAGRGGSAFGVSVFPGLAGVDPAAASVDASWSSGSGGPEVGLVLEPGKPVSLAGSPFVAVLESVTPAVAIDNSGVLETVEVPTVLLRIDQVQGDAPKLQRYLVPLGSEPARVDVGDRALTLYGARFAEFVELRYDTSPEAPLVWAGLGLLCLGMGLALFPRVIGEPSLDGDHGGES